MFNFESWKGMNSYGLLGIPSGIIKLNYFFLFSLGKDTQIFSLILNILKINEILNFYINYHYVPLLLKFQYIDNIP